MGDHSCYGVDKENWTTANRDNFSWKQPDIGSYDNPANPPELYPNMGGVNGALPS
jgi:hypothetical protein